MQVGIKNQKVKEFLIILIILACFFVVSGISIKFYSNKNLNQNSIMAEKYQATLQIPGYKLDKPFDFNTYEYNVEVDMDEVQVICNFFEDSSGCNQKINMTDKDKYDHIVEIEQQGEIKKYIIHFNKKNLSKDEKIRITSIDGIPDEWTNKSVKIKVNVETKLKSKLQYSFDGGKTYQEENEFLVDSNSELNIIVKDEENNKTPEKKVIISKVDKDKPKVELVFKSKSKDMVIIEAIAGDQTSEVDSYKFDDNNYSVFNTYKVKKAGTYKVIVKDKAGNVSDKSSIKIEKKDFDNEENENFNYKIKLEKNGTDFDSTTLICKSLTKNCKITLPKVIRNGGVFLGWSKSKDGETVDYKAGEIIEINKDTTLYAISYKNLVVELNKNGATSISSENRSCRIYNTETKCSVTLPTITRSSGTILGWHEDKKSQTADYSINETITLKKDTTLYAITYKELAATFNKNNASSISATTRKCNLYNEDKSCVVKTPTITRDGWSGIGWHVEKGSKTITVAPNSFLKISKNITYYAITGKTLTVTFNKNGADSISSPKASCTMYNSETSCSVKTPTITRSGWNIVGWNTNANADKALYLERKSVSLNKNINLYAITNKLLTVTFDKNGADSIGDDSDSCKIYNTETLCEINTPSITRNGWSVIGWNTNSRAESKFFDAKSTAKIKKDVTYYAITSKTLTATLEKGTATSISETKKNCTIYNNQTSCKIKLPMFVNTGNFNLVWESNGNKYIANSNYTLNSNTTFKATSLHPYEEDEKNWRKVRNLNIQETYKVGQTLFEYETNIPADAIKSHENFLDELYKIMPYLFNPGKVFIMNEESYKIYNNPGYAGLTHYAGFYFLIDIKYKSSTKKIGENVTIHELTHGWDANYEYRKGSRISNQLEVTNLYNKHFSNVLEDYHGQYAEFFAATVTNYYWFILEKDLNINNGNMFVYNSGFRYTSSDKEKIINIINKYKNG